MHTSFAGPLCSEDLEDEIERIRAEHHDSSLKTDDAGDYAASMRLSGCMTRDLVERFMYSSTGILERLELDNLLQCEEHEFPFPKFNDAQTLETYFENHGPDHCTISETQRMAGALEPFIGMFATLTSLCIATVGEAQLDCPYEERDEQRFIEWARMISSVRNNLRSLSFKQGRNRNVDECPRGFRLGKIYEEYRPMDQLFRRTIMPVLLAGPWPRIKRMEIRGLGELWGAGAQASCRNRLIRLYQVSALDVPRILVHK
ncbi:hypothetical protein BKA58DRAFT_400200 [Alternaria rosae]|uniref:uncharacterized protein n=1 Tax=Alternaria rosae TaxID=1187941 RepID=UPI001E8E3746|nr:uncharacterized protein BKA58DRAFT_400200 [Alternaria rosae]KAH6876080.1 hypothetical protein BKA58DRAFT_400200 [Alternaria rosae]